MEAGLGVLEGLLEWGDIGGEGVDGGEVILEGFGLEYGAGDGDAGEVALLGLPGDFADAFTHEGGGIDTAFAGDDEVGPVEVLGEVGVVGIDVGTGLDGGVSEGEEAEAESTGGAGARVWGEVLAGVFGEDPAELLEGLVCGLDILGADSLLRAVDAGGAEAAEEGVLDIGGDDDLGGFGEWGLGWGDDMAEVDEVGPLGDGLAVCAEELPAETGGEAEAAVIGGAAADTDEAGFGFVSGSGEEEFCEALGIQLERVVLIGGEHGEADAPG